MTNQVANINQKQMTTNILTRIDEMKTDGLALPRNYNASNALNVAFLELVDMKVKGAPLLEVVTHKSVYQSLLNMVLQGLSPAKNQVYFIPYGNELQMQRSYFGTQAALKRLDGVNDIWAEVIREGETFDFKNDNGRKRLVNHEQSFKTLDNNIIGAYAIIDTKEDGQLLEVMTKKQIDASWSQARSSNVHNKFGDQMAMRTVINRAAKNYINTSDDSDLLVHAINNTTENEYDDDKRAKDVTYTASEDGKAQDLLSNFKATQAKPEPVEQQNEEPPAFSDEDIDRLNDLSEQQQQKNEEEAEYVDFEEAEESQEIDFSKKTKLEIQEMLDDKKVTYKASANRDELVAVAEMALNGGVLQDDLF